MVLVEKQKIHTINMVGLTFFYFACAINTGIVMTAILLQLMFLNALQMYRN